MIEPIAGVRMELRHIRPKIWRRVDVPLSATLVDLHEIIQAAMPWDEMHLWEFMIRRESYGIPIKDDPFGWGFEVIDAAGVRLKDLTDRGIKRFSYTYDFGDDWVHDLSVGVVRTGKANIDYPALVGGARRCPPEDVGGVWAYSQFLEKIGDPSHKDHAEMAEWYDEVYDESFDPEDMDEEYIRNGLAYIARKRR